jgi:NAD+ kinase
VGLVGIVLKEKSSQAFKAIKPLIAYLKKRSIEYYIIPSRKEAITEDLLKKIPVSDLCITFGGDGTLLFAARVFSRYEVPIIGINLGGLGFITEFKESEVTECIECFLKGKFSYEERIMIDVNVYRNGDCVYKATGLNDLVINTGGISRLIQLEVSSGEKLIGNYRADGIIVATPTGSTAYSLAAGGPILEPTMAAFVISPICPHSLGARPLVVPSEEKVKIRVMSDHRQIVGTIDGQLAVDLAYLDEVWVEKSSVLTKLLSLGNRSFYDIVSEKLSWKG